MHRGAEETFDISADLVELVAHPVAVVCAGAKSILDIGKTLEYLESQGVAGLRLPLRRIPGLLRALERPSSSTTASTAPHDLARMIRLQREIGPGGVLIANPIPEAHALDADAIEARIAEAVAEAQGQGRRARKR